MIDEIIVLGMITLGLATALWVCVTIIRPGMLKYENKIIDMIYGPEEKKR